MAHKIILLLADGFEEIEALTSVDILRRAGYRLTVTGVGRRYVRGAHGITVKADIRLSASTRVSDALVLPGGGEGARNLASSGAVSRLVMRTYEKGKIVAAICASPAVVLGPLGILEGKRMTCYPGCERSLGPGVKVCGQKVVRDGMLLTGRGPGTAAAFAFTLVTMLSGSRASARLKKKMLFS